MASAPACLAQDFPIDGPEQFVEEPLIRNFRVGAFTITPRATADARYDTNVYNRRSGPDDVVFVLRPAARIATNLSRHQAVLDLGGEVRRYVDLTPENSEQWLARGAVRLDLPEAMTLTPTAFISRQIERRGTSGDEFLTDEPISLLDRGAEVRLARARGIIEASAALGYRRVDYDDATRNGVLLEQSFRDFEQTWASARIDYRRASRLSLFSTGRINSLNYRADTGRNSNGLSLLTGGRYAVTDVIDVVAAVGFARQKFKGDSARDFNGLDYSIQARWTPRPRLRLTLSGSRGVVRSPLRDASAIISSNVAATATTAIGDKLLVGLDVGFVNEDYRGVDRTVNRAFGEVTGRYRLTPQVSAFVGASYRHQDGRGAGARDYKGAAFRVGLGYNL